jgi:hypothetical protein
MGMMTRMERKEKRMAKRHAPPARDAAPASPPATSRPEPSDLEGLERVLDLIRDQLAATVAQWQKLNRMYDETAALIARHTGEVPGPRPPSPLAAAAAPRLAALAAAGRARRAQVEADGMPPWEARKQDPVWQKRWDDLLARVRDEVAADLTPEEVEAEITRASEGVRQERLARGHR